MTSIKIEFAKGGVFEARLLEDEAPKTCATIKQRLPFEYRFQQSIVSGQALVALPPDLTVERENQRVANTPAGTIAFLVRDEPVLVPDEIYIAYGVFISRGLFVDAKQPVNVFAQIESNLDDLKRVGQRVHQEGAEMVRFSLI
jgi:hypothetical protein